MPGLDHHECPAGLEDLDDRVRDLRRESLLHLRALREPVDQTRDLREPGEATVVTRDVRDMRAPVERSEMMLTHRIQRDVAHQHHLVVVGLEGHDEMPRGVLVEPAEDLAVHLGDAARGAQQSVALRVLADREENLPHRLLQPFDVDARLVLEHVGHVNRCSIAPVYSAMNGRLR